MWKITKGYKQGRAVMFYDIVNLTSNEEKVAVSKDVIVSMCEAGEIKDTKVQWWKGKSIVRCKSDIPGDYFF